MLSQNNEILSQNNEIVKNRNGKQTSKFFLRIYVTNGLPYKLDPRRMGWLRRVGFCKQVSFTLKEAKWSHCVCCLEDHFRLQVCQVQNYGQNV